MFHMVFGPESHSPLSLTKYANLRECYENLFDFNHTYVRHLTEIRGKSVFITLPFNNENAENQIAPYLHLKGYPGSTSRRISKI